jgi:hypothetical protein
MEEGVIDQEYKINISKSALLLSFIHSRKDHAMSQFSDDQNNDEFMNASAEEWSKPSTPEERPPSQPEPTDRWGSPLPDKSADSDPGRWGSDAPTPSAPAPTTQKTGSKWWIILLVILVVLCLCACLVMIVLPWFGFRTFGSSLIPPNFMPF